jgi:DNA-directed RNA polymerase specialized sigma24 family protein
MMSTYNQQNMPITSQKETGESSEEILKRFDWYITVQTKRIVRLYPALAHQAVVDLEIDELMQRVRIKLWRTLEKRTILYPHNYIKRMIRNELIDMQRQKKPTLPLPTDEEEQWQFSETTGITLADTHDPADEVEQRMESSSLLEKTVPLVLRLPPRQRLAMMCSLKDRVDDLVQLVDSFKAHQTDIEKLSWPAEHYDRRVLQASLVVARRALAKQIEEN